MKINLLFSGLALTMLLACSSRSDEVTLRLTNRERVQIDTLYTQQLDSLRPIWDSLCEANYQFVLAQTIDSIVQERLEEEEKLRKRGRDQKAER